MTSEYPELVLSTYKKMRDNGELYTILPKETTAALKNACLKVYDSRYNQDDADILSVFFNVDKMKCDFRKVISDVKSDYFKALYNHIRDETETNERNSDLLAWLINFKPRPSGSYYKSLRERNKLAEAASEETVEIVTDEIEQNNAKEEGNIELKKNENVKESTAESNGQDIIEAIGKAENKKEPITKPTTPPIVIIPIKTNDVNINGGDTEPPPIPVKPEYVPRFSPRYITISCIILLFVGSSSFVAWERSGIAVRTPDKQEKCMYWDVDHYEPIDCKRQVDGATIIPLDLKALEKQRKINLPDTLTSYSIGNVWYKGFVKDHEFFTAAGPYPTDTTRVLKKLTPIILAKYISNNRYLQTRLTWLLYATIFITLCGFGASRLKKEVKQPVEKPQAEEEEPLNFTQQQTVNC